MDKDKTQINVAMLAVHSTAFGLYMFSVVIFYTFYSIYYLGQRTDSEENLMIIAWILCAFCNFLAQFCLCTIFWQFAGKQAALPGSNKQLHSKSAEDVLIKTD